MRKMDYVVIAISLFLAAFLFLLGWEGLSSEGKTVIVYKNGIEVQRASLTENTVLIVGEKDSQNIILVQEGYVSMKEATCPDGICLEHKPIHKTKETIVCLPNKVYVEIEGAADKKDIDAIVQ